MRILWIGKRPGDGGSGDEIFDRRTLAALRAEGAEVTTVHPEPHHRFYEAATLFSGLLPYQRGRFLSRANRTAIIAACHHADVVICSWEPLDALAVDLPVPTILIVHNIASTALRSIHGATLTARFLAGRSAHWERRWYRRPHFGSIAVLSRRDLAYVTGLPEAPPVMLTPPGMPPSTPLAPGAAIVPELVISGTFDWPPKRRDIVAFAHDYAALPRPRPLVRANGVPPGLLATDPLVDDGFIRFGVITDRFTAGHKLKTLAYIARNQIVLSFAEVGFDFAHIPDAELFIRRLDTVAAINECIELIRSIASEELSARFARFQAACARAFTWANVARALLDAATALTKG
jgi:hypothetical protein